MVSRRKILSRSRDDLNLDSTFNAQEEEEDVWFQKDKLYKEHIQEVLDKWTQIDDEIWAKVIVFERNRRVAKAYARAPVLTINGSDDGFDGMRIGLCGFDNPMRDQKTEELKRHIGQGVKIKMDDAGNILIRRYAKSNVYVKSTASNASEETSIGADILKLPNQALESEKIVKLFDMKKFQSNVNRELRRAYPDRRRLETQCLSAVAFVKSENDILECPIWVLIVNVVAMDMLKSKLPPVQRPMVDIKNRPRIPIPDEDPYSVAGNGSGGSSGSSGFGASNNSTGGGGVVVGNGHHQQQPLSANNNNNMNGTISTNSSGGSGGIASAVNMQHMNGSGGHVAATREQLLMQSQQLAHKRSEKPPKLPPRDNIYSHDVIPKPDYDDIDVDGRIKLSRGKSDKGKDNKKYDDPYYCGLRARVPNFVKSSKSAKDHPLNGQNGISKSVIAQKKSSMVHMPISAPLHPAMHAVASAPHMHPHHIQQQQQMMAAAAAAAAHGVHHHHPPAAAHHAMWHARSFESGIGSIYGSNSQLSTTNFLLDHKHAQHAHAPPYSTPYIQPALSMPSFYPRHSAVMDDATTIDATPIQYRHSGQHEPHQQTFVNNRRVELQSPPPPLPPDVVHSRRLSRQQQFLQQQQQQQENEQQQRRHSRHHHHHHHHHHDQHDRRRHHHSRHHSHSCTRHSQCTPNVDDVGDDVGDDQLYFAPRAPPPSFAHYYDEPLDIRHRHHHKQRRRAIMRTRSYNRDIGRPSFADRISPQRLMRGSSISREQIDGNCNCVSCYTLAPLFGAVPPSRPPRSLSQQQLRQHQLLSGSLTPTADLYTGYGGMVKWCSESDISELDRGSKENNYNDDTNKNSNNNNIKSINISKNNNDDHNNYNKNNNIKRHHSTFYNTKRRPADENNMNYIIDNNNNNNKNSTNNRNNMNNNENDNDDDDEDFDIDFDMDLTAEVNYTRQFNDNQRRRQILNKPDDKRTATVVATQQRQQLTALPTLTTQPSQSQPTPATPAPPPPPPPPPPPSASSIPSAPISRTTSSVTTKNQKQNTKSPISSNRRRIRESDEISCLTDGYVDQSKLRQLRVLRSENPTSHELAQHTTSTKGKDSSSNHITTGLRGTRNKSLSTESFFEQPNEHGTLYMYGGRKRIVKRIPSARQPYDKTYNSSANHGDGGDGCAKVQNNINNFNKNAINNQLNKMPMPPKVFREEKAQQPALPPPCWRGKYNEISITGNNRKMVNNKNNNVAPATKAALVALVQHKQQQQQQQQLKGTDTDIKQNKIKRYLTNSSNNHNNDHNNNNNLNRNNQKNYNVHTNLTTPTTSTAIKTNVCTTKNTNTTAATKPSTTIATNPNIDNESISQQQQQPQRVGRSNNRNDINDMESIYGYLKPRKPRSLSLKKIQILDY